MTAWIELALADGSDEHFALCNRALVEVQQETLRRAAAKIRAQHAAVYDDAGQRTAEGLLRAADLIDPAKTEEPSNV
jgi:hypothetical protein